MRLAALEPAEVNWRREKGASFLGEEPDFIPKQTLGNGGGRGPLRELPSACGRRDIWIFRAICRLPKAKARSSAPTSLPCAQRRANPEAPWSNAELNSCVSQGPLQKTCSGSRVQWVLRVQEGRAGGQGWPWALWCGSPGAGGCWGHSVPWAAASAGQVAVLHVGSPSAGCQVLSEAGRTVVGQDGPSACHTEHHLPRASPPAPGSAAGSPARAAGSLPGTLGGQEAAPHPVLPASPWP